MEALFLSARVNRRDIAYVSHTLESYEGLAVVTTIDAASGLIRITVSPFFLDDVRAILYDLRAEVELELLDENGGKDPSN